MEASDELNNGVAKALSGRGPSTESLGVKTIDCQRHGPYESTGTRYVGRREIWTGCNGCAEDAAMAKRAAADAEAAYRTRVKTEELLSRACIPKKFIGKGFDNYEAETTDQKKALRLCSAYADRFESIVQKGHSLILAGGVGTGKSHLACAILQSILPKHVGIYMTMLDLIRLLRSTWDPSAKQKEAAVLDKLATVPLLVVDEVGMQYDTDGERILFTDIMDRRYLNELPVILLMNKTTAEFKAIAGDRLYDRLSETATWIPFNWESRRKSFRRDWPDA